MATVAGQRGEVERGLGIGGEHDHGLAVGHRGEGRAGANQRERAAQAADIERSYDQCMIAAILESGEPRRLYMGLSLLVSAAADGRPARALVGFGALGPLLADDLPAMLAELRDTAIELDGCRLWACAAAVEETGTARGDVEARLDGVMSMPRFLREAAGADLVFV